MPTIPAQMFDGYSIPEIRYSTGDALLDYNHSVYGRYTDGAQYSCSGKSRSFEKGWFISASSATFAVYTGSGEYIGNTVIRYTYDDKPVYMTSAYASGNLPSYDLIERIPEYVNDLGDFSWNIEPLKWRVAWLMVYGDNIPDGYDVTYDLVGCIGDSNNPVVIPANATITNMSFTPDSGYTFNSGSIWIDGDGFPSGTPVSYIFNSETGALRVGVITSDITIHVHAYIDPYNDPNNPDLINGESDIPGGDIINVPGLPGISAVSSGVIGLFNPSIQQMQLLSDFMWTDFGGTATTTDDILKEIVQAIKRTISNPLDYIVGLNIIPSQGLSVGGSANVRFGFVSSDVSMPRLTSQYFVVDCGTLSFDKLCGDTFLDYAPYSKFTLYLPYIGVKEMDANDFVGHTIGIVYHGDVVTGGITAYVLKDGSVMYQYAGCCALTVPINADSWGNVISGAVQIATSIVAGGAVAGGAGASIAAAKGAADVASNPSMLSPQVLRSGAVSGGAGCMAVQKPFVIREAVRFHSTNGFNTVSGYPSYYYRALSEMHGFTSVLDVHLHGITATDAEISEIESLLKEGVIL